MKSCEGKKGQAGFSLIELVIAMGIMVILLASVSYLMKGALVSSNAGYELTDAQEGARIAQELMSRDLVVTGDGFLGMNDIRVNNPFAQRFMQNTYQPDGDGFASLSLVNSDDNVTGTVTEAAHSSGTPAASTVRTGTDRITVLTADPDSSFAPISFNAATLVSGTTVPVSNAAAAQCSIGDVLFVSNGTKATFGTVTDITGAAGAKALVFANDTYQLNNANASTYRAIQYLAMLGGTLTIRRMLINHYYVDTNGLLHKRTFGVRGGVGFTDSVVAEHVTDLAIRYNLFALNASFAQIYPQPVSQLTYTATSPAIANVPSAVRQVETTVTVETVHNVLKGQKQTVSNTLTTSLRNMQFRNALQP